MAPINRKVSARELRRRLNTDAELTHAQIVPAVNHLLGTVEALERRMAAVEIQRLSEQAWTRWQRLRWLCTGEQG